MKKIFFSIGFIFLAFLSGCSGNDLEQEKNIKELEPTKKELENMEKAYEIVREEKKELEAQIDEMETEEKNSPDDTELISKEEYPSDTTKMVSEISFEDTTYRLYERTIAEEPADFFPDKHWITKQEGSNDEEIFFYIPKISEGGWKYSLSGISPSGNILYFENWAFEPGNFYGLQTDSKEILWREEGIRAESEIFWSPDRKQAAVISGGFFDTFPKVGITEYGNVKKINWVLKTDLNFVRDGDDAQFFYWKDNETFIVEIPENYSNDPEIIEAFKKEGLRFGINEFITR